VIRENHPMFCEGVEEHDISERTFFVNVNEIEDKVLCIPHYWILLFQFLLQQPLTV
jgi:hypothetical protein